MSHPTSIRRTRLQLEHIEDRCTPSAGLADPWVDVPVRDGGPHAASVAARDAGPRESAAAHRRVLPIKLDYRCAADLSTSEASAAGFATRLGHWTARGRVNSVHVDPAADRAELTGTLTVVTAGGDKLFVSFTASWRLSTGKGTESITVTGGTGRFAGASGYAIAVCTVTADPASQTFSCNCKGFGILLLDR